MKDEFEALFKNNIWVLIPRLANDNVINTKWVFKIKQNEDGTGGELQGSIAHQRYETSQGYRLY